MDLDRIDGNWKQLNGTGATGGQGAVGPQGNEASKCTSGKPGQSKTVIVMPPASAPSN